MKIIKEKIVRHEFDITWDNFVKVLTPAEEIPSYREEVLRDVCTRRLTTIIFQHKVHIFGTRESVGKGCLLTSMDPYTKYLVGARFEESDKYLGVMDILKALSELPEVVNDNTPILELLKPWDLNKE